MVVLSLQAGRRYTVEGLCSFIMTLCSASCHTGALFSLHWDGVGVKACGVNGLTAGTGIAWALTMSDSMTVSRFISFDTHCSIFVIVIAAFRIHGAKHCIYSESLARASSGRPCLTQSSSSYDAGGAGHMCPSGANFSNFPRHNTTPFPHSTSIAP